MPSLREIRGKIKSVKNTQQITKAMKMVAAARLRRAQGRILAARPFAQRMEELIGDLLPRLGADYRHPLFVPREGSRRALVVVTSDKGLCGAFNANIIRHALNYLKEHKMSNVQLFVVGRKGRDYFRRMDARISKDYVQIFNNLNFAHAELIAEDLMKAYVESGDRPHVNRGPVPSPLVAVDLLYNEFKSVIQQKLVVKTLLPLASLKASAKEQWPDFIYEPRKEQLIDALIPRFIKAQIFRVLLESSAAELGARMTAMENATNNASDLLESLTLRLNRSRQASITKEILEVVSGAEALR